MIENARSLDESVGFGLATAPFANTDDEAFFFPSDQHLRALEFMGHSLWTNARLGVVTADHGCGKSLLIKRLLNDLDERIVSAAIQRENMPARDFLQEILRQFGFALEESDKTDRRRCLERFMRQTATAFAPASVGNVAVGFDVLGHSFQAIGDRVSARRTAERGVRIGAITGTTVDLPREPERNTAGMCVTPTSAARRITSARSLSKLSWARFMPMSMSWAGNGANLRRRQPVLSFRP